MCGVGRPVVPDDQPERVEQGSGLLIGQARQVDFANRQRVEYTQVGGVAGLSLQLGELFGLGSQFGETRVDVADQFAVRVVSQLKAPDEPPAPSGEVDVPAKLSA